MRKSLVNLRVCIHGISFGQSFIIIEKIWIKVNEKIDLANEFNKHYQLARHYPLLHKTEYFNSKVRLPNTELLHNKITLNNLSVSVNEKNIIDNLNLKINQGEIHAIMGPNGSGKSTLSNVLAFL